MARPTSADVRAHVRNVHDETLAWQRQQGLSQIPSQHSHDQEEANLGKRLAKLLIRRTKALGTKPSGSILTQAEATLINSLQGVPSQGCAVSINLLSEQRETLSSGAGQTMHRLCNFDHNHSKRHRHRKRTGKHKRSHIL